MIVFSTYVKGLRVLADILRQQQLGYVMIHGQVTLDDRSKVSFCTGPYVC